jgi:ElaB/YqjD/DUF883 family membrane-anchored ribosome-binding protein
METLMPTILEILLPKNATKADIQQLKESLMGKLQDTVDNITVQLGKAKDEIVAKIDELKAQVEAGETPDFTNLEAAAQALDDVVPDAAPDTPPSE